MNSQEHLYAYERVRELPPSVLIEIAAEWAMETLHAGVDDHVWVEKWPTVLQKAREEAEVIDNTRLIGLVWQLGHESARAKSAHYICLCPYGCNDHSVPCRETGDPQ